MNDALAALIWFTFVVVCPAITLLVLAVVALTCRSLLQKIWFGAFSIVLLVAAIGPVFIVNGGLIPWWLTSNRFLVGSSATLEYLIWQYALASTLVYVILSLLASFLRSSK